MTHLPYTISRPTLEPAASDFILDSYLMHIRTNRCACGAIEQWSDLHAVSIHRSAATRRLQPTDKIDSRYPIGISRLPVRHITVCHCCILSTEPTAQDLSSHDAQLSWAQTLSRKYSPDAGLRPAKTPQGLRPIIANPDDL